MGSNDNFDDGIEGQMKLTELFEPPGRLFAVSRIFARARKEMNLAEQKTFVYALSEMRFTEKAESLYVKLDKKTLAGILGIKSDENHLSVDLYNAIKELTKHSYIEINDKDLDLQSSGTIISSVTRFKNVIRLRFNEEYIGFFTGLSENYITMWSSDIFGMQSRRSVQFYEYLRQNTDTRENVNQIGLGVKALKELFGIPKNGDGSYVRESGRFDRLAFEKRIIEPICSDLSKCRMIALLVQPDGKYYEKVKRGNRVLGYRFYWTYTSHPAVAAASEVKELQERVDKNPQVLKVAKDLLKGKKTKNRFNDFEQRKYDTDELERKLIEAQEKQLKE